MQIVFETTKRSRNRSTWCREPCLAVATNFCRPRQGDVLVPAISTLGAWMLVGNERFDVTDIHRLYESDDYPLRRRTR